MRTSSGKRISWLVFAAGLTLVGPGCAAFSSKPETKTDDSLQNSLAALNTRLDAIESKLNTLAPKTETASKTAANTATTPVTLPQKTVPAVPHPAEHRGGAVNPVMAAGDPEAGFQQDSAIQTYRKSLVLLEAGKTAEAALGFSGFVEQYPDHPLAGSAQFHVGEAYFRQREYKLALHEYQRVLMTYDRSPHIADTLRRLAESEDALEMKEEAARHRQLLSSLFPMSPAAALKPQTPPPAPAPRTRTLDAPVEVPAAPTSHNTLDGPPPPTAPIQEEHKATE